MTDTEFIAYCEAHSMTDRALFNAPQIARLLRLAGDPHGNAHAWDGLGDQHWRSSDLSDLCKMARKQPTSTGEGDGR